MSIDSLKIDFKAIWPYVVHKNSRHDIYIGRPSKWGNPFSHKKETVAEFKVESRLEAVCSYKKWVLSQPKMINEIKKELKGKVLGCWCTPKLCHGHVLAAIANDLMDMND